MFQVTTKDQTFTTDVRVEMIAENGKTKTNVFKAKFRRVNQSDLDSIHERMREKTLTDAGVVREILVGWQDVKDENGQELEFNDDNLAALLNVFPVQPTLVNTFFNSLTNAVRKN